VVCLGLTGALRRTLATTNPIEPALSVTRRVMARVTRWRDGKMRWRWWCVAGLLRAESKFRRVKGHKALPTLMRTLEESSRARPSGIEHGVA
jgi:putative transposase